MSATVLRFSCHKFSAADLAYLDRLTTRMIAAGDWSYVQRVAGFPTEHGRIDLLAVFLPGRDIPSYSIQRHSDGTYCLMNVHKSEVIKLGRTVQTVTSGLYPSDKDQSHRSI
jgi:hypothetical protein